MITISIKGKLVKYLQFADEKKLKAIYTLVEDEMDTEANDWDENFVKELKHRSKGFTKGAAKTYS